MPSLHVAVFSGAPVALWDAIEPISEQNFVRFGVLGGVLTTIAWLVCASLGIRLWNEVILVSRVILRKPS